MWNAALEVYKPAGRLSTDRGWRIPATAEWAKMELAAVLDLRLTGATICVLAHPITWTLGESHGRKNQQTGSRVAKAVVARAVLRHSQGGNGAGVYRKILEDQGRRYLCLRVLRATALQF